MNAICRLCLGAALAVLIWQNTARAADLLDVADAFQIVDVQRSGDTVTVSWAIAPGYAVFRDRVRAIAPGLGEIPTNLDRGVLRADGEGGVAEEFLDQFSMTVHAPASSTERLDLVVQGCHQEEPQVCFNPYRVSIPASALSGIGTGAAPGAAYPTSPADKRSISRKSTST
jgi:thiol:disulfide interchange protein DsbD